MEWINYHHLRYFWAVAREGGVAQGAARLRVSAPAVSEQIRQLEEAMGERLFRREGRNNRLTEAGEVVLGYAEEIFALGGELLTAVKQRPGVKTLRLQVGIVDSFPKFLASEILRPVFGLPQAVHAVCHEGTLEDLLPRLAAHRLDIVLADEAASSSVKFRAANHVLGVSGTSFCAEKGLAGRLRRRFPEGLHGAPALLPAEDTPFRRGLEGWFRGRGLQPRVVAEFADLALMKVMAAAGLGFTAVPTVAAKEAMERYGFEVIGEVPRCRVEFHAITAARRSEHPAVLALMKRARRDLFG